MATPHNEQTPLAELIERRYSRRAVLQGGLAGLLLTVVPTFARAARRTTSLSSLGFTEISKADTLGLELPAGYSMQVLLRWGDGLFDDSLPFDPAHPHADAQARQFGFNNDYTAFMPLPKGSENSSHGLLCVNHEYTNIWQMFPGLKNQQDVASLTAEHIAALQAAQGFSVVEIQRNDHGWQPVKDSDYARRFTANSPIVFAGPAAGHSRLKTTYDRSGRKGFGTVANCAGGVTPWGTVLTCEENLNDYFPGEIAGMDEEKNYRRYGVGSSKYAQPWARFDPRFDIAREPNEPNRFGWVVEYDPYDAASVPVKHTALGRFKHESATVALAPDGRVCVYSGDDEKFEYLYRYVSMKSYIAGMGRADASRLLDEGVLHAARFDEDGTMQWLPLVHGAAPLDDQNGFLSQADILIEARRAADLVGATPMDRPEDVEVHPGTGKVYVSLTKNPARAQANAANPRQHNIHGHIIELSPPLMSGGSDHAAPRFHWEMFLRGGDSDKDEGARYLSPVTRNGMLSCPDNLAIDPKGRLWIGTDGQPDTFKVSNALYACDTEGKGRGGTRLFLNGPRGCEITGPSFTPDGTTLFLSIQHPAEGSGFDAPSTRWPDFDPDLPARPSVITITKDDGGMVGD